MDYKYIEQLLDRYFEAETTEVEERILRTFFEQADVPAHLQPYQALFAYEQQQAAQQPGPGFEARLLSRIEAEAPVVKVVRPRRLAVLRPLWQAAAAVAVVVLVSIGAQRSFDRAADSPWDYNPAGYTDTYQSPQQAYRALEDGLELFQATASADTVDLRLSDNTITQ